LVPAEKLVSPIVEMRDVVVRYDKQAVLTIDQLAVQEGEVLTVIGPNGAGKSTLLLALARLIRYDTGRLYYQGRPLRNRDDLTYRRRLGFVLQAPLLLNASVFDNVATGLRFRRHPRGEIAPIVDKWLARVGISHLRDRKARQLSGGEAQRVSLARALAPDPDLLLLDEPFSALDPPTRARLLEDFQALLSQTGTTTVFVTHDMDEALLMGDRIAVILGGRLRQIGPADQVFSAPTDHEVADFVGVETAVAGEVVRSENGQVTVLVGDHQLEAVDEVAVGRPVLFCLRPEDVTLWAGGELPPSSARNRLSGTILRLIPRGPLMHVVVDCGFQVRALITRRSAQEMTLEPGTTVTVTFKASAVHLIPR
jgi:tungstate transport system ATP-binding protein